MWQEGRFEGDLAFWRERLSQANDVQPVKEETCLRFYLSSEKDFQFFHEAVTGSLQSKKWTNGAAACDGNVDEREDERI